ncbi:MAG: hypothetical protein KDJ45_08130 [Hyphomicrobiaceae bacterium]|nr:hypothetical protein [Hyphomicrobiaceae bacterium]MCC0011666.1 hypothetical protein [Hyphomicrobiaceae bacterium]
MPSASGFFWKISAAHGLRAELGHGCVWGIACGRSHAEDWLAMGIASGLKSRLPWQVPLMINVATSK